MVHPLTALISDKDEICCVPNRLMRRWSTVKVSTAVEKELAKRTHAFSQAASEVEQCEHWQTTVGRVKCARSTADMLRDDLDHVQLGDVWERQ